MASCILRYNFLMLATESITNVDHEEGYINDILKSGCLLGLRNKELSAQFKEAWQKGIKGRNVAVKATGLSLIKSLWFLLKHMQHSTN